MSYLYKEKLCAVNGVLVVSIHALFWSFPLNPIHFIVLELGWRVNIQSLHGQTFIHVYELLDF